MEKRHMDQGYSEHREERVGGIPDRRVAAAWNKQMTEGSVRRRGEDMEEDHMKFEQNWRSEATMSDKWDTISSGKWIHKTVWNRMVTVSERDQLHKTPVTSTWTSDFLTRKGEGRKAMVDW